MNAVIDTILSPFVCFMAEWSVRWLAVAALPVLWLSVRPPRAPQLRYLICLGALVAGLVVPAVPRWGGLLPTRTPSPPEQVDSLATDTPEQANAASVDSRLSANPHPTTAAAIEVVTPSEPDWPVEIPVPETRNWRPVLFHGVVVATAASWLLGVLILLLRWIAGSLFLRHLGRTASTADATSNELFTSCRCELQLHRAVRLAFHAEVLSPLVFGPWRPAILLPFSWRELSPALQRACLLHELDHLRRRDDWIALALRIADLAFFFHPCFRWLRSRLECEREMCCDDLALASGFEPQAYAQMLRDFASQSSRMHATVAVPFGQRSTVKSRIQHILEENMVSTRLMSRSIWIAGSALVLVCLIAGSVRLFAAGGTTVGANDATDDSPSIALDQPVPSAIPKDTLHFGGKTFKQWQNVWRTDLKPEVRIEAFQALATFGKHGYASEAAPAIIEAAASYDPTTSDQFDKKVYRSALEEIYRLGGQALPALESELRRGNLNARRFCAIALKERLKGAKSAEKGLLEALNDSDGLVRQQAALSLEHFAPSSDAKRLNTLVEILEKHPPHSYPLYSTSDREDSTSALRDLKRKGKDARTIVSRLARLFGKGDSELDPELAETILAIGGEPNDVVPVYVSLLEHPLYPGPDRRGLLKALREEYGVGAKPAAPYLISRYQNSTLNEQVEIVDTLISIGADAKDVLPLVKSLLQSTSRTPSFGLFGYSKTDLRAKFEGYLEKHAPRPPNPASAKPGAADAAQAYWSPVGKLTRTMLQENGTRYYRLSPVDRKQTEMIYCQGEPGIDLDAHLNQRVQLFGVLAYHKSLRQKFMLVSQVRPAAQEDQEKAHAN